MTAATDSHTGLATSREENFFGKYQHIGTTLRKPRIVRALLRPVISAYDAAGLAGRQRDLPGFKRGLERTRDALSRWAEELERALAEIPARRAAHEFYLRLIASGRVSAFALTESSAGSDTARIRTRAVRKSVELRRDPRGFHTFVPEGVEATPDGDDSERRVLADISRFEFDFEERRTFYRLGFGDEEGQRVEVLQNDYVYGEDESKFRVIVVGDERVTIHDLGSPRRVELKGGTTREVYDYYQVDGSKMWITNGHIAGAFSLYARTERGPTGFMLDGHAEGLTVGKDEEKMGQRGGPTNELTFSAVRIPVTCVIGFEGRGQENALETLNVGRAGLLVSSLGVLRDLVCDAIADLRGKRGRERTDINVATSSVSPAATYWFGRALEEMLACESLAANMIGHSDHPGTQSARMESAIGKYFGGESMHRILDWMEHAYGAQSSSAEHDLEKKRRDARIINIYEGTNEVQRFLIIKDLVGWLRRRPDPPAPSAEDATTAALAQARARFLDEFESAVAKQGWGDRAWQDVRYQPLFFKLVEMAGWVCVADAAVHRNRWVQGHMTTPGDEAQRERLQRATDAFVRQSACVQIECLADTFQTDLRGLADAGREPAVLRLADLVIDAAEHAASFAPSSMAAQGGQPLAEGGDPIGITVIVQPAPRLAPRPRLEGGQVDEPLWELDAGSSAALESAVRIAQRSAPGRVRIHAVAAGDRECVAVLRRALACGADLASWIDLGDQVPDRSELAAAMATLVKDEGAPECRLLLAGRQGSRAPVALDAELGLRVAALLGGCYLGDCDAVRVLEGKRVAALGTGTGSVWVEAALPASVVLVSGSAHELETLSATRHVWAERVGSRASRMRVRGSAPAAAHRRRADSTPPSAGRRVRAASGAAGLQSRVPPGVGKAGD